MSDKKDSTPASKRRTRAPRRVEVAARGEAKVARASALPEHDPRPLIVGIGASAGGLEAYKSFFARLERMKLLALLVCLSLTAAACSYETGAISASKSERTPMRTENTGENVDMTDAQIIEHIRKKYAERLAGLYVEKGGRRIVVRLAGPASVPPESHTVGSERWDVVFVPAAAHTFAQLNRMMTDGSKAIQQKLPTAHARYVDERTGEIVIAVDENSESSEEARRALSVELGAPVRILVQAPETARPAPANPL